MVQHDSSDAAVEESPREAPDAADDAVEGAVKEDIRMGQIATYSINGRVADVANIRVDAFRGRRSSRAREVVSASLTRAGGRPYRRLGGARPRKHLISFG